MRPSMATVMVPDRSVAEALDAEDPLAQFRDRFVIPEGLVYLDGNSLGMLPRAAITRIGHLVSQEWGHRLIRSWEDGWMDLPTVVGDELGAAVLGSAPGQVVLGDSTTVCFYKLASAALDLRAGRTEIVTDRDNFPTDRYVIEGLAAARGLTIKWLTTPANGGPSVDDVAEAVGPATALVTLSHTAYRSGFVADLRAITAAARNAGALTLWDLSHSAGSVPLQLDHDVAELAVGCTYKYLCGGPGAPAYMYVRHELQAAIRQPIWGWLGREDPFAMAPGYVPGPGMNALQSGTPPILGLACVEEGVRLIAEAGMPAIRAKSIALTSYVIELADSLLAPLGVGLGSPRDPAERGSQVALTHPDARALCAALAERGVIPDFRAPDIIRIGLSPLTTRFVDAHDGISALRSLLTA
jgi:kynureninase